MRPCGCRKLAKHAQVASQPRRSTVPVRCLRLVRPLLADPAAVLNRAERGQVAPVGVTAPVHRSFASPVKPVGAVRFSAIAADMQNGPLGAFRVMVRSELQFTHSDGSRAMSDQDRQHSVTNADLHRGARSPNPAAVRLADDMGGRGQRRQALQSIRPDGVTLEGAGQARRLRSAPIAPPLSMDR
jgi:hypothetical protein